MKVAQAGIALQGSRNKSIEINPSTDRVGLRLRVANGLSYFLSFVLAGSAVAKLVHIPKVTEQMAALGFDGGKLTFIAGLEIASALLFAYPRTRSFGLLMVSAYLGGAIATHVGHDQFWRLQPEIVLALFWLAAWLRDPEIFGRTN